ncbi:type VI secretion system protein TssL, long form [Litoreibacter halocynthiae]|uniref:type VI secretion system protein TssL, long form n=1 Tax=Litoreibacter halocynthiae TaxID=1242689 RepID=UPI0024904999|nr:type VI secretion system protein TssL, long form [Litoreibacter halocynthiae]
MASDKDKTVIGGKLPTAEELRNLSAGRPASPPAGLQQPPSAPPAGGGQRTVIGGGLPQSPPPAAPYTPQPPQGGFASQSGGDAWMGGGSPTPSSTPAPRSGIGGASQDGFFPTMQSQQPEQVVHTGPKIALHEALRATGLGKGGPSNPIVAAAANLLILFGRLRTQMVEMDAIPLMEHVTREMEAFHANCVAAGVDSHEADVARYCLCGTADDIVQNIPGTDRDIWIQYSMVARFYNVRTSGVGFFEEVDKAMQAPAQRFNVLELMLMCLSLGFEGKYRTLPGGSQELARIRASIYESLRRVHGRPDEDISVHWTPVELGKRKRFGANPLWIVASAAAAILLGVYLTLNMLISNDSSSVVARLLDIHPEELVGLQRAQAFEAYIPPEPPASSQLENIREKLKAQINDGSVAVDTKGDFIFVRVNNLVLFGSGSADVKAEFSVIAADVAKALDDEPGPVRVVGYTDNIPMSGRGRFKTNQELSEARAKSVGGVLGDALSAPGRLQIEGKGEVDPIADNATKDGRAQNRRVEIMIQREETLQ